MRKKFPELQGLWNKVSALEDMDDVLEYLTNVWINDYCTSLGSRSTDIVQVDLDFSYLFDIFQERLIAAWGVSSGKNLEQRDKSRMRGHPLGGQKGYHRGHAIPHTLGGGTDINLVPQKGSLNIGAFRVLEIRAVNTPGSFYFTNWEYQGADTQIPSYVWQGLLCICEAPDVRKHKN